MAVITITITESSQQIISGIPKTVSIETNIPSTIYYTLDGSDPTIDSDIYTSVLYLPTNASKVVLKLFATNGIDSSSIIEEEYFPDLDPNTRFAHSATEAPSQANLSNMYPFGTPPINPNARFTGTAYAGVTVDDPTKTEYPNAVDKDGYDTAFSNLPYTLENYAIKYSTTNELNQSLPNIGTLPAKATVLPEEPPPTESVVGSNLFDPRSFVIFQDTTTDPEAGYVHKMMFTLIDPEEDDVSLFYKQGLDAPPLSGSFLRNFYNPKDQTMNSYYFDSRTNKWIISKAPYIPKDSGKVYNLLLQREPGARFVFEWIPFARRVLF